MDIGREIRQRREAKGWSQAKLAGASDMGVSGISQIETGARNPSVVTLSKIAEALELEIADLFPKAQARLPLDAWRPPDALTPQRRALRFEVMYHADDATRRAALRSAAAEELEAYVAELASIRDRREGEIAEAQTSPLQLFRYARRLGLLQGEAESYAAVSGALAQGGDRTA